MVIKDKEPTCEYIARNGTDLWPETDKREKGESVAI